MSTLHARRLALLTEARRLRNLRMWKRAGMVEATLRAVTHELLMMEAEVAF